MLTSQLKASLLETDIQFDKVVECISVFKNIFQESNRAQSTCLVNNDYLL